ncbi:helix-turn-helix domain-containing protein [Leptospira sanjuanensis]|nr:helix-turn-helix transcriptional regulator [Leptospira sanjuanensis]MCG6167203.1 helix-turn-helix transcriptional regulator [Leptospira sanjuanensis]
MFLSGTIYGATNTMHVTMSQPFRRPAALQKFQLNDGHSLFDNVYVDSEMKKVPSKHQNTGFPDRLKELRIQKGFSQEDLAKLVGLHKNHIGRYERGDSQPTADKITKLAGVLEVTGDFLLGNTTEDQAKVQLGNKDLLNLFSEVEKLSNEDKEKVTDFLDAFLMKRKMKQMIGSK